MRDEDLTTWCGPTAKLQRGNDRPASKTVRETEAEAVAFIVGTAIGIRSSVDATDYIQLYDGNVDTLRQSLHRIQATAKTILGALPLEAPVIARHETTRIASLMGVPSPAG